MSDDNTPPKHVNNVYSIVPDDEGQCEESPGTLEPGFKLLPNKLLNNEYGLSIGAFAVLCYLLHHKPGFKVHDSTIMRVFNIGRDKRQSIFRELREKGFVRKSRIRDNGAIVGWKTLYSNHPEFAPSSHKSAFPPSGDSTTGRVCMPLAEVAAGKAAPLTILSNNNTRSSQDQDLIPTTTIAVVVSDKLITYGFTETDARFLTEKHGATSVQKIIDACEKGIERKNNPAGWIRAGLEREWQTNAHITKSEARRELQKYSREENCAFFNSLAPGRKLELFEQALTQAPFCYDPCPIRKEDILTDFTTSAWFFAFMSVIGREEIKIEL